MHTKAKNAIHQDINLDWLLLFIHNVVLTYVSICDP